MGEARAFTVTTSTVEDGCIKTREEIRSSVDVGFLTLTHISCLWHRPLSFEVYVYTSCVILNLICNRIFLYVRFTWRATRNYIIMYSALRGITPHLDGFSLCYRLCTWSSLSFVLSSSRQGEDARMSSVACA